MIAGYTVPTTTMMAPVICVDAIDCSGYKRETTCYDGSFRAWAKKNCKLYCDLCKFIQLYNCIHTRFPRDKLF